MFGVDVRVHPFFWLMSAILGWDLVQLGFGYLLLWMACVFVSILVHEFGHVCMGRVFGTRSHIVLYSFGGLAVGSNVLRSRWQRIMVCFAGPLADFILFAGVWLGARFMDPQSVPRPVRAAGLFLLEINLFLGIVNLLPLWPLDGGQMSRDFLGWLLPERGSRVALGISLLVAGLLAINALNVQFKERSLPVLDKIPYLDSIGGYYMAFLFGWLAFNSYQALQFEHQRRQWHDDHWQQ